MTNIPGSGAGDEVVVIRLLADLREYMQDMEAAGRPIENLAALFQNVADSVGIMGERGSQSIDELNASFRNQQQILEENREEIVAIAQLLTEGARRDPKFTSKERLNALREENAENRRFNEHLRARQAEYDALEAKAVRMARKNQVLSDEEIARAKELRDLLLNVQERKVFRPENITRAGEEFKNLTQRVAQFGEQSGEVWEVFANQMSHAQDRAKMFREEVNLIKDQARGMKEPGQALQDLKRGFDEVNAKSRIISSGVIQRAFAELAEEEREAASALKEYINTVERSGQKWGEQPLRQAAEAGGRLRTVLQNLNQVAKVFFGISLFSIAQRALSMVTDLFREATRAGVEWSRTMFNMSTSVRALQRTGVNITMAEMNAQVQKLSETFKFFTTRQLQEGIAQIALLTRNVGLSKDEIFKLSEATATLAIITGKDFAEQGLLVARSIASGYTEALQRAGIAANRLAIQEQALRMGINKTFMQMTEQERAAVTLELVLSQVAAVSEDVAEFQESMAGKVQDATIAIQQQKDELGTELLPIQLAWLRFQGQFLKFFNEFYLFIKEIALNIGVAIVTPFQAAYIALLALSEGTFDELMDQHGNFLGLVDEMARQYYEIAEKMTNEGFGSDVDPSQVGMYPLDESIRDEMENAEDTMDSGMKKLMDITLDWHRAIEDAEIEHGRDMDDIRTKFGRGMEKIRLNAVAKRDEINRKTNDKIISANEKFRIAELKHEEDFLESMRKLREKLVFDLEDAVRERDAKQVLRLIRDFNLKQTQMVREEDLARMQRERDFQAELSEIARQREIRLRELAIETKDRQDAMIERYEQERDDAELDFKRELEDIDRRQNRRLDDLKSAFEHEMKIRLDHSAEVLLLAAKTANQFREIWAKTFGLVASDISAIQQNSTSFSPGAGGMVNEAIRDINFRRATGGTVVARRPTTVLMGERGAEAATFVPLHRVGVDQDRVFGGNLPGTRGSGGSDSAVRIMLAEGLKAEIVQQAMDGTANVIIEEMRK